MLLNNASELDQGKGCSLPADSDSTAEPRQLLRADASLGKPCMLLVWLCKEFTDLVRGRSGTGISALRASAFDRPAEPGPPEQQEQNRLHMI